MQLNIVITSTRPGRVGPTVADWFAKAARAHLSGPDAAFDVVVTDLAEIDLPLFDEPHHPRLQKYEKEHTKRWSAAVAASDAFVFVLPEYNFTAPPSFVNAVDYLLMEWRYKPAGFVSYGGISGGLRSTQTAKLLLAGLSVMPIPEQVIIPNVFAQIHEGVFTANDAQNQSVQMMVDELARWAGALAPLRSTAGE
ncbi:MAG TPA: NADPH-dependent FMN reductase [Novosphingobium sp.]|nr:NADPH-dependent FMN reductase [Novosphingobium sp.]